MFWPATSSESWFAIRPVSAVCRPWSEGMPIALRLQVEHVQVRCRAATRRRARFDAARVVERRAIELERPHQVIEEGQFDLHQRAVEHVFALQLVQETAQLRAARERLRAAGLVHQRGKACHGYGLGRYAEPRAATVQQ